jgi:hypothetical protein
MSPGLIPSFLDNSSTTASLALPRSGAAATLIFNASPSHPTIWSRDDPGTTLTVIRVEGWVGTVIGCVDPAVELLFCVRFKVLIIGIFL